MPWVSAYIDTPLEDTVAQTELWVAGAQGRINNLIIRLTKQAFEQRWHAARSTATILREELRSIEYNAQQLDALRTNVISEATYRNQFARIKELEAEVKTWQDKFYGGMRTSSPGEYSALPLDPNADHEGIRQAEADLTQERIRTKEINDARPESD